jgi:hypothetical protein
MDPHAQGNGGVNLGKGMTLHNTKTIFLTRRNASIRILQVFPQIFISVMADFALDNQRTKLGISDKTFIILIERRYPDDVIVPDALGKPL